MFEYLKKFDHIFVTGPQRSGTTIAAKMVAMDTGYKFIDEFNFHVCNKVKVRKIMAESKGNVFQCPGLCRDMVELSRDNTAVVLMRRNPEDILKSQNRINWKCERTELFRYSENERFGLTSISEIKYMYWDKVQKFNIKNYFEMPYEFLCAHALWLEQEKRKSFHAKQTEIKSNGLTSNQGGKPNSTK